VPASSGAQPTAKFNSFGAEADDLCLSVTLHHNQLASAKSVICLGPADIKTGSRVTHS